MTYTEAYEELKSAQVAAAAAWQYVLEVMNREQAKLLVEFERIQREYAIAMAAVNPR